MAKVSWGIISTAKIGVEKVIPAMQKGKYSEISAIASRDFAKARKVADSLNISRAYGSYEELLEDKEIDAIYIPLPNHLHLEWTIKSLKAGKHVLCEKPITMNFKEAEYLQNEAKKFPNLHVMEAFMYRHHPQMVKTKELVESGTIGELRSIQTMFSYYNDNPADIRNQANIGGGGLLDIGCYCISLSRFLFAGEPKRVCATIENDPKLRIDRFVSAILEFEKGTSTFTCSTQLTNNQYAKVLGTRGKIEIDNPFTPSSENSERIRHRAGSKSEEIVFEACDHYTIQGDLFSLAILNKVSPPTPLSDGVANMKVIDKIIESSQQATWIKV